MPEPTLELRSAPRELRLGVALSVRDVFDIAAAALARRVTTGAITTREFEATMRELVADVHALSYAAGRGGAWSAIEPAEWRAVERVVERQYDFLRGFRDWVAAESRTEEATAARARLYGAAARHSFERGHLREIGLRAELPAYPGDGTTDCYTNCRCRWSVRTLNKAAGDFVVSWRLGSAEHCQQCRKRSRVWKALRVRGNALVDGYEVEGCFR